MVKEFSTEVLAQQKLRAELYAELDETKATLVTARRRIKELLPLHEANPGFPPRHPEDRRCIEDLRMLRGNCERAVARLEHEIRLTNENIDFYLGLEE
jgi:hypothetical protein